MLKFSSLFLIAMLIALHPVPLTYAAPLTPATLKLPYQKPPRSFVMFLNLLAFPTPLSVQPRTESWWSSTCDIRQSQNLAQPMLRIAGLRIDPATNGRHHPARYIGLRLIAIATGKEQKLALPPHPWLGVPRWSPDGQHFAFTNTGEKGIELWIGDAQTGKVKRITGVKINGTYGSPLQWLSGSSTLLVQLVAPHRHGPPAAPKVPTGPTIQESQGKAAPVRTYEDLLQNAHDEELFTYYVTSQLAQVEIKTGKITKIGAPAIFDSIDPSPDGQHILLERIVRPFSYLLPVGEFAREVEVWNRTGKFEYKLASLPSTDGVPIEGVLTGPREYRWAATKPATLLWAEAQDGGDPKKKVPYREQLFLLEAPFTSKPLESVKLEQRFAGFRGFGADGFVLVSDYDRDRRWIRFLEISLDHPTQSPKVIWERSVNDHYGDPGFPISRVLANGQRVMLQQGSTIYLWGRGASVKGNFPFLDRFDLSTHKSERIFQAADKTYEQVEAVLTDDGSKFITSYETPDEPPNLFIREAGKPDVKIALTHFTDPAPMLRGIKKKLVLYKRADGVQLSFTLYLPLGYREGERLPTIVWAYPLEYTDAATAGQVPGSQYYFNLIDGISQLFLLTQGYAILNNATMPVIGDPETMNNTYIEQTVADAQAAIDKAAEMGVTDRNRVGVGGHSYGAFMTANLLAHSNLFKAGVARSGAYNRTLTPFGFQSERRTLWEAPDLYMKVSPFIHADKIKTPLLLIHGQADDNPGTFPIQSERLYQAIKGNGGIVRYVTLPYEAHGYAALESVEHTLWEMIQWYDRWVKNAPIAHVDK